ncbi:hypothetical protein DFH09DRAFT_1089638 [Mycena vulgaris]|nr:hypothetical protein DFH09DRAFT_1089638 [Mycena vulgaris]
MGSGKGRSQARSRRNKSVGQSKSQWVISLRYSQLTTRRRGEAKSKSSKSEDENSQATLRKKKATKRKSTSDVQPSAGYTTRIMEASVSAGFFFMHPIIFGSLLRLPDEGLLSGGSLLALPLFSSRVSRRISDTNQYKPLLDALFTLSGASQAQIDPSTRKYTISESSTNKGALRSCMHATVFVKGPYTWTWGRASTETACSWDYPSILGADAFICPPGSPKCIYVRHKHVLHPGKVYARQIFLSHQSSFLQFRPVPFAFSPFRRTTGYFLTSRSCVVHITPDVVARIGSAQRAPRNRPAGNIACVRTAPQPHPHSRAHFPYSSAVHPHHPKSAHMPCAPHVRARSHHVDYAERPMSPPLQAAALFPHSACMRSDVDKFPLALTRACQTVRAHLDEHAESASRILIPQARVQRAVVRNTRPPRCNTKLRHPIAGRVCGVHGEEARGGCGQRASPLSPHFFPASPSPILSYLLNPVAPPRPQPLILLLRIAIAHFPLLIMVYSLPVLDLISELQPTFMIMDSFKPPPVGLKYQRSPNPADDR